MADEYEYKRVYKDTKSGGQILRHRLVDQNLDDYKDVYEIAVDKANLGLDVYILPVISPDDPLRETLFAGAPAGKCPDLKIDEEYFEVKTPVDTLHYKKLNNAIKKSQKQAPNVVIRLLADIDEVVLRGVAKGRFTTHLDLKLIEFRLRNGKYLSFSRSDFAK